MIIGRVVRAGRALASGTTLRFVALGTLFVVVVARAAQATLHSGDFPTIWAGAWWVA